jgi:tripartite-type tricarboxylate transporter receptor subunit TctC
MFMKSILAIALLAAGAASAQDYPNKPIRVIVPYAAGGLPDTITRLIQPKLADALGQQLVVENRGGAGGISGTEAVAKATPDGYTLLVADVGQVAINPHIFSKLPYAQKDLVGVGLIANSALFITLHQSVPASSFKEFIAYVKANPGKVNYGSSGIGSIHHLSMEAFKGAFDLNMVHIPYKGMGQAVPALLGGQVAMVPSALPAVEAHVKAGTVKLVAISTAKRSPQAPEVPTIAEMGAPGYDFAPEIGLLAPAGTPPAIVARLSAEVAKAVQSSDVAARFRQLGIDPVGNSPEAYNAQIRAAYEKYGQVVKAAGVRAD